MIKEGAHVFADTNVILEAHRTQCWKVLTKRYQMDTVWRCVEECETGNQRTRNPIYVDTDSLKKIIHPKSVSDEDVAALYMRHPNSIDLDVGERELLAYALKIEHEIFLLCSPDKACIRAAFHLGFMDRYVALENLTEKIGLNPSLKRNFTKKWMEGFRTDLILGKL
jgi:hypothetical protein